MIEPGKNGRRSGSVAKGRCEPGCVAKNGRPLVRWILNCKSGLRRGRLGRGCGTSSLASRPGPGRVALQPVFSRRGVGAARYSSTSAAALKPLFRAPFMLDSNSRYSPAKKSPGTPGNPSASSE